MYSFQIWPNTKKGFKFYLKWYNIRNVMAIISKVAIIWILIILNLCPLSKRVLQLRTFLAADRELAGD